MSLLPSGAIETGGYNINNSLRFRSAASAYLLRTPASAGNRQIMTYSFWVKRGAITGDYNLTNATTDASNSATLYFNSSNNQTFDVFLRVGATNYSLTTSQVFRDPSAWYHIVVAIDTTQATSSNRTKVYVNGSQVTNFLTANYVPQNSNLALNNNVAQYIGYSNYFDGYMAEVNFIDGQALTPSSFGQTDAVTGSWVAKKYTGTYGTNGFYLPFSSFITGGSLTSATVNGFSSYAYNESGADYVNTSSTSGFNVGTGNFTLETFIKFNTVDTWDIVMSYNSSNVQQQNMLYYYHPTGEISFYDQNTFANLTCAYTFTAGVWYHVALVRNSGTLRMYINGVVQPTTLGYTTNINTISYLKLASQSSRASTKGQLSNLRFNNTAVYTSNFTPPTSALTAISGTQLLTFQNSTLIDNSTNALALTNTATGNPSAIADNSGNGNYWNFNNMNLSTSTATTYDLMKDVPTLTSATVANYCVLNPLEKLNWLSQNGTITLNNANMSFDTNAAGAMTQASFAVSSGKWYFEVTLSNFVMVGIRAIRAISNGDLTYRYYQNNGQIIYVPYNSTTQTVLTTVATSTSSDIIGVAFDLDSNTISWYKNGTLLYTATGIVADTYAPSVGGAANQTGAAVNFGQRPFSYTPPTGFVALNTYNLPTPTILQGNKYMDATLYTQNGAASNVIVNAGQFKPDLVWIKCRSNAGTWNALVDSVRGGSKTLYSNATDAESTDNFINTFNSNGFTLNIGDSGTNNTAGRTQVGWQWQAGQGSTSSNTSGSITSTVSVNASAGFSIVTYTGNLTAAGNATVGHGLGVAPKMVITKRRSGTSQWMVWHTGLTNATYALQLQSTDAQVNTAGAGWLGGTVSDPTSTTFGTNYLDGRNINGQNFVALCWAEIAGFSKFGSYVGNYNVDGVFVYCGFRPKFILIKAANNLYDWELIDTSRSTYNSSSNYLQPNLSSAEYSTTSDNIDILSNGFKMRNNWTRLNDTVTYIYAAFAENPTKYALAR